MFLINPGESYLWNVQELSEFLFVNVSQDFEGLLVKLIEAIS